MTAILDQDSLKYVTENGYSATDGSGWGNVFNIAWSNVTLALTTNPDLLDPKAAAFVLDYMQDYPGATTMNDLMWGAGSSSPGAVFEASGKALTDGLVPFFASTWIRNDAQKTTTDLYTLLNNTLADNEPPPGEAIAALGGSSANITTSSVTLWSSSLTATQRLAANESLAQGMAQQYFVNALQNNLSIPASLIDAYIGLDPATAISRISGYLQAGISGSGTVYTSGSGTQSGNTTTSITISPPYAQPDLLAAYKRLNAPGPSTTDAGSPFTLDADFQSPAPVLSGWDYYATWALATNAKAKAPIDASLLQQLDTSNPVSGSYVRFEALKAQSSTGVLDPSLLATLEVVQPDAALKVCKLASQALLDGGKNLNADYLAFIAKLDPASAEALCVASLQAGLQPLNRLVTAPPLPPSTDHETNTATPTVRVSLVGMGSTLPVAGDVVQLQTNTGPLGATQLIATSRALTAMDLTLGYIDVPVSTALPTGGVVTNIYSCFVDPTTQAFSPLSVPLPVSVVTNGATLASTTWASSSTASGQTDETVIFQFDRPMGGNPSPADFLASDQVDYSGLAASSVIVDAANSRLIVHFVHDASQPMTGPLLISYNGAAGSLYDAYGNLFPSDGRYTNSAASGSSFTNPMANQPAALPAQRPIDPVAYAQLQSLHPTLAASWTASYTTNGFGPGATTSGGQTGDIVGAMATSIPEALQGAVARVSAIDNQIKTYFDDVKRKTDQLNEVNQLLAVANTGMGQLPLNSAPTDKLADKLNPTQFNTLLTQFNALSADMKLGITISSATTKSDLEGYIQELKTASDGLNNTNQLALISLQNLSNQKQVMLGLVSTLMSSQFESLMKIVSKM